MIFRSSPHRSLEKRIGHRFRKISFLETALLHPSALNEKQNPDLPRQTNQRLEFLGDAVLGMLAAELLYEPHASSPEGELTRLRSAITNTKILAQIASSIDLGESLVLGRGEENSGGRQRESNLADVMEAVLGAVYLDGGLKAARSVFIKLFGDITGTDPGPSAQDNPKGLLQEWTQSLFRKSPDYRVISSEGPPHARLFVVDVYIGDQYLGTGQGPSKRAAEAEAASMALKAQEQKASMPPPDNNA